MDVKTLIHHLGGPTKVARQLGFEGRKGACRVSMWISRNRIPAWIQLQNMDFFKAEKLDNLTDSRTNKSRA